MNVPEPSTLEIWLTVWAGNLLHTFFQEYVDRLNLTGRERVLELGPSAGNSTRCLARRLQPDGGLTAVDISPIWVNVARRRLHGYSNVALIAGDIRRLRIADGWFDALFISFVLHDIPPAERAGVLAAAVSKVAPGGLVFVREPLRFISRDELAGLAGVCGLEMVGITTRAVWTQGAVFEGRYRKN